MLPGDSQADAQDSDVEATLTQSAQGIADAELPTDADAPACVRVGQPATATHRAMLEALNSYRVENGLAPLVYSKSLEAAATAQVNDLWQRGFFAHENPDGNGPGERAILAGFCHRYVGENIAAGQTSIPSVMTAWKNSPGHNANMLEPEYKYVGVSFSVDGNGRLYWAQEFAYELP